MITQLIIFFFVSLLIAIAAFVYSYILTGPGMILEHLYAEASTHWPAWLHKPVISCEKCVAGQLAFWLFPFWVTIKFDFEFDPVSHLLFICLTIYLVEMIKAIYTKMTKALPRIHQLQKKSSFTPPEIQHY
jgi:small-conductance mechanosensitive channel